MGKLEFLGLVAALTGLVGVESLDGPIEDRLIENAGTFMAMTPPEFEAWCDDHGARPNVELDDSRAGTVACAWIDRETQRAWHAALHFDGIHPTPTKADAGLVDASESTLLRLVANEFGAQDMKTGDGFPAWEIELDGRPGRLTVAPFDDITVVRMAREDEPAVLSMR